MLDINRIRENPEAVKEALKKKLWDADFTELLAWDKRKKELIQFVEGNKAEMNRLSASVPQAKKNGEDVSKIFAKVKEIAAANAESDKELKELEEKIFNFLAELPNIPDDDLLGGGKENNKPIRSFGKKPEFNFQIKDPIGDVPVAVLDLEFGRSGGCGNLVAVVVEDELRLLGAGVEDGPVVDAVFRLGHTHHGRFGVGSAMQRDRVGVGEVDLVSDYAGAFLDALDLCDEIILFEAGNDLAQGFDLVVDLLAFLLHLGDAALEDVEVVVERIQASGSQEGDQGKGQDR